MNPQRQIACFCVLSVFYLTTILTLVVSQPPLGDDSCGVRERDRTSYKYRPNNAGGNQLPFSRKGGVSIIGDVNDVLNGRIRTGARNIYWPAKGIIGFGAGAVGPLSGLGEAMMANGFAFVRQTDNKTANYFQTISGTQYRSPFAMFAPRSSKSDGVASYRPAQPGNSISFNDLYRKMSDSVRGAPFCFYGLTEFAQMEAIAISKAPIYSEPLFGDLASGYYTKPGFRIKEAYGLAFGCVANFSRLPDAALGPKLNRALYVNPLDAGSESALQVHTHVLSVKPCVKSIEQIRPETALDVYHLVSNSTVRIIQANVFKIDASHKLSEIVSRYSN